MALDAHVADRSVTAPVMDDSSETTRKTTHGATYLLLGKDSRYV